MIDWTILAIIIYIDIILIFLLWVFDSLWDKKKKVKKNESNRSHKICDFSGDCLRFSNNNINSKNNI